MQRKATSTCTWMYRHILIGRIIEIVLYLVDRVSHYRSSIVLTVTFPEFLPLIQLFYTGMLLIDQQLQVNVIKRPSWRQKLSLYVARFRKTLQSHISHTIASG